MIIEKAVEFIFGIGLFVNAALFIPQVVRLIQVKDSQDLSLITFLGFCIIQFFTILHGYYFHDWLLMLGYGASLLTCGAVTILIIYYRRKNPKITPDLNAQ